MIRQPAVAGMFYPAERAILQSTVRSLLDENKTPTVDSHGLQGLIVPHAGYVYSGPTAAVGYACMAELEQDCHYNVVILAPSHRVWFAGAVLPTASVFRTPLGDVPVSKEALMLLDTSEVSASDEAHREEHAIEVQLPFLQSVLRDFSIIPLLLGEADADVLADAIRSLHIPNMLVVVSSDLSHYEPYEQAVRHDRATIARIIAREPRGIGASDACGCIPIHVVQAMAVKARWQLRLLDYRNSGDTAGDRSAVVGYAAIGMWEEGANNDVRH
jgi:AmmeMemoRadiSam system protein B